MKADIERRFKASGNYIIKQIGDAMKCDYYDGTKEQYKTQEFELFVKSLVEMRKLSGVDDQLAAAMGNVRIG
jgi:hypothetical protein